MLTKFKRIVEFLIVIFRAVNNIADIAFINCPALLTVYYPV
jgi:hypothetical protein